MGIAQVVISRITMAAPGMSKMGSTSYIGGGTLEYLFEASVTSAFKWEVPLPSQAFCESGQGTHTCSSSFYQFI